MEAVKGETRSYMLDQEKMGGGFMECSICLDAAAEPVVTMCGHLYCWPCIYKWMQQQHAGDCPVCKSHISEESIIPLYGRGRSLITTNNNNSSTSSKIPDRPSPRPMVVQQGRRRRYQYDDDGRYMASASVLHSTAGGVLCGMADAVLPWVSRNQERIYYSSPYVIGSRMRRMQELRIESSLSQIWGFFFCCAILCFLFF